MADVEVRVGKNLPGWTNEELDVVCVKCNERFGQHAAAPPHGTGKECDAFEQDLFSLLVKKALESK